MRLDWWVSWAPVLRIHSADQSFRGTAWTSRVVWRLGECRVHHTFREYSHTLFIQLIKSFCKGVSITGIVLAVNLVKCDLLIHEMKHFTKWSRMKFSITQLAVYAGQKERQNYVIHLWQPPMLLNWPESNIRTSVTTRSVGRYESEARLVLETPWVAPVWPFLLAPMHSSVLLCFCGLTIL